MTSVTVTTSSTLSSTSTSASLTPKSDEDTQEFNLAKSLRIVEYHLYLINILQILHQLDAFLFFLEAFKVVFRYSTSFC